MKINRYDSIYWNDYGSWDWTDSHVSVKECDDGDMVYYDDAKDIIDGLESELKGARDFAEQMHELVDWQEGFIDIPWKIA